MKKTYHLAYYGTPPDRSDWWETRSLSLEGLVSVVVGHVMRMSLHERETIGAAAVTYLIERKFFQAQDALKHLNISLTVTDNHGDRIEEEEGRTSE